MVLVTDAMSALGLQPGRYPLGYQDVDVREDCAVLAGTTTLCGSIATMDKCVRHFKEASGKSKLFCKSQFSLMDKWLGCNRRASQEELPF